MFERIMDDPEVYVVKLRDADERALMEINERMGLGLSRDEMLRVRAYFRDLGRDPTDVELQAIAQAWSEHCCYKSSRPVLERHIFNIPSEHALLVVKDDAGVVEFDEEHAYVFKIESHNHPSAVEPYGGAATGVGGILRDVLNMGAQPVALVDPLFFGPLDVPYEDLPPGVKHPRFLMSGVVAGIRDYGNRVGIPTVAGLVCFHPGYVGNVLVNVGCVGIARKDMIVRSRVSGIGLNLVLVGGRTGRDGIHGVNFASRVLEGGGEEERTAVQLGNPILKEPLMHVVMEANEAGIIEGMKDMGGGGLSSVVGEICLAGGVGAEVWLDRVPLKETGMAPWEIWVSESQERMLLAISDENMPHFREIVERWGVEHAVIGRTVEGRRLRIYWKGRKIFDMDLRFLSEGPRYCRPYILRKREVRQEMPREPEDYTRILMDILASPNVCSREAVVRQYDHEVRGCTVIKPLHGVIGKEGHGDAPVIKPLENSWKGIAITTTANPYITEIDPYWGSVYTVDEAFRNLVAVGARPHAMADNLNLGNPERPEVMGDLHEVARGLGDAARFMGVPYVSGNVSLYNESHGRAIPPTPVIMAVGVVEDVRKAVTSDLKHEGNAIYVVGSTRFEMGGSEYYRLTGAESTLAPRTNLHELKNGVEFMLAAISQGIVRAAHDVSEGGIAVCVAEMCIGGDVGVEMDITSACNLRPDMFLFSESPSRWLVEVPVEREEEFRALAAEHRVPVARIGMVGGDAIHIAHGRRTLLSVPVDGARERWKTALERLWGD